MENSGWIKLHRKIQDCFIWDDKPYDRARAWIDLILSATHRDRKTMIDGRVVMIGKGSFLTSALKLSEKWGWSRKKTDAFLKMLENERMISMERTTKGTTVTIVNYGKYQVEGTTEETTEDTAKGITEETTEDAAEGTAEGTQNKNVKNEKNINNNINTMCSRAEAERIFESLWKLYPVKKGKGQVSLAAKRRLVKVGCKEMARAIDRYILELEKDGGWRKPQNGSTFFNSGYVDYLDANYVPGAQKKTAVKKNQFTNFPQRENDYEALERRLLERQTQGGGQKN